MSYVEDAIADPPAGLCGVGGCAYLPHAGAHSWERGKSRRSR